MLFRASPFHFKEDGAMDQPIMLSPQDLINMMVAACASIITISTAVTLIVKWITKAKEPEQTQNMRIDKVERKLEEVDRKLARDNERLLRMETGNYIMQEAILALIEHALNDNEVEGLKTVKKKLEGYLIEKKVIV